ncbi:sulfurtransferase [Pedobacter frigiditerrae]|uniref:Sulfurtransferase n=1 Tax=Pedobacter frigiditerrae TaxID=2530452 RepID=A0A4R0N3B7_9SPHI|nr:sulfurtransferase [Pedobacter frigiditerrae]TCC94280.1 sulfurtransferase [Pedobacter frigiditerrae]
MKLTSIIQPAELLNLNPDEFALIDASAGSKARYDESHLANALYIDLNTDLANIKDFAIGGRHPLPTLNQFSEVLQKFGIDKDTHVIIYDDKNGGNAAARFWWMLKAIGHEKVQVLNGGFDAAIKVGFPTDNLKPKAESKKTYPVNGWQLATADIDEVELASKTGNQTIVDVRDANRFAGLTEPIDLIAGHIPGALNIPFTGNLDENGLFLSPEVLREKYVTALADVKHEKVIVHCGSGVTACHMLLAMDYAGLEIPKLYVGSWSEWSRNHKDMVLASRT